MFMKFNYLLVASFFGILGMAFIPQAVEQRNVDTKTSTIQWTGKKVTGQHTGMIAVKNGVVSVDKGAPVSAKISVDMNSITCTDLSGE